MSTDSLYDPGRKRKTTRKRTKAKAKTKRKRVRYYDPNFREVGRRVKSAESKIRKMIGIASFILTFMYSCVNKDIIARRDANVAVTMESFLDMVKRRLTFTWYDRLSKSPLETGDIGAYLGNLKANPWIWLSTIAAILTMLPIKMEFKSWIRAITAPMIGAAALGALFDPNGQGHSSGNPTTAATTGYW